MKAVVQDRYGPADVLAVQEIPDPAIGDDGVLVRVRAASVNALDWHTMRGRPLLSRFSLGLRAPKESVRGVDVAGIAEAVGRDVTGLRVGDEVFGTRDGAFAELVAGRVRNFVHKPANLTFEQAAAIPVAAATALQALRDVGGARAGQHVLLIGAGGGVGTFAVQLAKAFGAIVTAVTSAGKLELVRAIGADEVVDYARADVMRGGRRFEVILDVGGFQSLHDLSRVLAPGGTVALVGAGRGHLVGIAGRFAGAVLRSRFRRQRIRMFLARTTRADLEMLANLAATGKLVPVIDRAYTLEDAADAIRYVEAGRACGKVVIMVDRGSAD